MDDLSNQNRLVEYDIIRIIAIMAVIMIHCSAGYVVHFVPETNHFIIGNILDSCSRIAVPFFVMISGIFMLDTNRILSIDKLKFKISKLWQHVKTSAMAHRSRTRTLQCSK